jgi:hypothetical protein
VQGPSTRTSKAAANRRSFIVEAPCDDGQVGFGPEEAVPLNTLWMPKEGLRTTGNIGYLSICLSLIIDELKHR